MTTIWKNKIVSILNTKKSAENIAEELFQLCDKDKSGKISLDELKELIKVKKKASL